MLWKCCTQYASTFGKLSSGHRTGKGQFSSQSQRRAMPKTVQIATWLHSSHALAKQCSKFSKPGINCTWTMKFQIFKMDWEKAKAPEIKSLTSTSALLTTPKPLTVCITQNCGKFLKRWDYQTTWPVSWEICRQVNKQQLELDMEQQTGSKLGKEYVKAVYCQLAYLTSMQSTSMTCQAGWSTSWNQDCQEKYQ